MSNFDRELVKELAKCGGKVIIGNVFGNVSPEIEWIKWLSYESDQEKKKMKYFDSKKVSELTYEELEEASRYSRNKVFANLFKKYDKNECNEEEYMKVYDFMCSESIEDLMLSKLTSDELLYAKEEISRLTKLSKEELAKKVDEEQTKETYEELSMVDAYILHMISDVDYVRSIKDLNRKIDEQIEQNEVMSQKSLYYSSKNFI